MSSHHFVKDGQEPSVWVMDIHYDSEVLGSLLEWCPLLYVCEPAIEKVLSEGIKIDVTLVSHANATWARQQLEHQFPIEVRVVDESFSSLVTNVNASYEVPIHVLGWSAKDSLAFLLEMHLTERIGRIVLAEGRRFRMVKSGVYDKWLPAGSVVKVHTREGADAYVCEKDGVFALKLSDASIVEDAI